MRHLLSRLIRSLSAVLTCLAGALVTGGIAHASVAEAEPSVTATFEGATLSLADGWGDAKACASDGRSTRCYRSEAEMEEAEGLSAAGEVPEMTLLSSCSSSLRLYTGSGFGGSVLYLSTQYTFINLSPYGFSNVVSSYRVGACASYFYDGSSGGLPIYPGTTSAYASASTMLSGWDNRISSVYIG